MLRDAAHNLNIFAVWQPDESLASRETQWTRAYFADVEPYQAGVYVNFLGDEGPRPGRGPPTGTPSTPGWWS